MRVVFAGTPEFAERALHALAQCGEHEIVLVVSQPDRPAGRGMRLVASPVKRAAQSRGLPIHQPPTLQDPQAVGRIVEARPDVLVVAAYGLLLPKAVLSAAPCGAINIHASLLPRWRGAAPIERALLAGDAETGVTIMRMDAGLDTGPMLSRHRIAIAPDDDAGTLRDRLAALGAKAIIDALRAVRDGTAVEVSQPGEGITYARKMGHADAHVDWTRAAVILERQVRALRPAPGAVTALNGEPLKIWRAHSLPGAARPGEVVSAGNDGLVVGCGEGQLRITELQRAGGRRMRAADFLAGRSVPVGTQVGEGRP